MAMSAQDLDERGSTGRNAYLQHGDRGRQDVLDNVVQEEHGGPGPVAHDGHQPRVRRLDHLPIARSIGNISSKRPDTARHGGHAVPWRPRLQPAGASGPAPAHARPVHRRIASARQGRDTRRPGCSGQRVPPSPYRGCPGTSPRAPSYGWPPPAPPRTCPRPATPCAKQRRNANRL